ncbi:unnamed protein product [Cylindrotheca closterium]|uniref:Ricin B lectin domain-containing protein n=1 Tax=Cylindrotheca closterium TaxID=2856 RepID=A0AAD2FJ68_9STRA|nr:unnamed protein product [Cylindrotheca closterium]
MAVTFVALLLSLAIGMVQGEGVYVGGYQFAMADCPNRCLTHDTIQNRVELADCRTGGNHKAWELNYSCGKHRELKGFFQIRNVLNNKCIADPEDCAICNKDVSLVDCESERAAWFSHGHLHKTAPKAYSLYSARCWLNEGQVRVLATPSLESKTCPEDFAAGACDRLEWNADHYSRDIVYYEWSFNEIKTECEYDIFANGHIGTEQDSGPVGSIPSGSPGQEQEQGQEQGQDQDEITVDGIDLDNNEEQVTSAAANNEDQQGDGTRNTIIGASCAAGALLVAGLWRKRRRQVRTRSRIIQDGVVEDDDVDSHAAFEVEIEYEYEDEVLST